MMRLCLSFPEVDYRFSAAYHACNAYFCSCYDYNDFSLVRIYEQVARRTGTLGPYAVVVKFYRGEDPLSG